MKLKPSVPKQAAAWKADLERIIAQGLTSSGQTEAMLKEVAMYGRVWEGLSGMSLTCFIVTTMIALPGYKEFFEYQNSIVHLASRFAELAEGYYSPYCSKPVRKKSYKKTFSDSLDR